MNMFRFSIWIASALLLAGIPLFGKEGVVTEDRFVTLLSPKYEEGSIRLSFEPVQEKNLRYRVYRSTKPIISAADIEGAEFIAEITAEDLPLYDKPVSEGRYYYAVTVTEEFPELVPYLNTTTKPVDYAPLPEVIDNFEILQLGPDTGPQRRIALRFTPARPEYAYNLYTSKLPIEDLNDAQLSASVSGADGQFEITVDRDAPLYLAITTVNRLGVENETLIAGRNLTPAPIAPAPAAIAEKKEERKVKEPAAAAAPAPPSPRVVIDRTLKNSFFPGLYEKALESFENLLLREDLSSMERAEANFYSGQCYFYLGEYRKAVKRFVLSKNIEDFNKPADAWIERSLSRVK
jgi:tetratricopeptide (TPR) repeat protein